MENTNHKAGYISIVGKPNVGKSTLMNVLVGERLSIITSKAQTTRHRIMGILNGEDFQIVYSDTPGVIKPAYELQKSMMKFVSTSLEDADIILFVREIQEKEEDPEFLERLKRSGASLILILNKLDLSSEEEANEIANYWKSKGIFKEVISISALKEVNTNLIIQLIVNLLPIHPPYFDKDALTDKPERFFAAEIVREKIFLNYKKEIPYSCEVVITEFKETDDIIRIRAEIFVERDSQKGIIIGHKGESLKKVGIQSRQELEKFFGKHVHLETHVKVEPDWRSKPQLLERFGYNHKD